MPSFGSRTVVASVCVAPVMSPTAAESPSSYRRAGSSQPDDAAGVLLLEPRPREGRDARRGPPGQTTAGREEKLPECIRRAEWSAPKVSVQPLAFIRLAYIGRQHMSSTVRTSWA